jgi:hypothetical protein
MITTRTTAASVENKLQSLKIPLFIFVINTTEATGSISFTQDGEEKEEDGEVQILKAGGEECKNVCKLLKQTNLEDNDMVWWIIKVRW